MNLDRSQEIAVEVRRESLVPATAGEHAHRDEVQFVNAGIIGLVVNEGAPVFEDRAVARPRYPS